MLGFIVQGNALPGLSFEFERADDPLDIVRVNLLRRFRILLP